MDGTGFIMGYVSSLPDRIDEVGAILRHILETPLEFNADQLERAKTKLRTRLVLQGESSMRRLMAIGLEWLYCRAYAPLEEESEKLRRVSVKEIESMLSRFDFRPKTTVRLVPA
jgi:predicted Zn-dependent peptidase